MVTIGIYLEFVLKTRLVEDMAAGEGDERKFSNWNLADIANRTGRDFDMFMDFILALCHKFIGSFRKSFLFLLKV